MSISLVIHSEYPFQYKAGHCGHSDELMDAEVAVYWRMVCKHLNMEAHVST